ncbi:MAG: pyridoxal-phosphate dependent enzyme [Deltaproteobacteria bacterium]|nr:pyridoxal-phosphate dependent enzyme [Deltaproteobacteria bacterium]
MPSPTSALAHAMPALAERLPSVALGEWPTPVQRAPRLGRHLGVDLWIKRDDLSALRYGGNKVRKLELLLAAAETAKARRLLTLGGIGSNHIVATALHGRERGFACTAIVVRQPLTPDVRKNLAAIHALGVELCPCKGRERVPLALLSARHRLEGSYLIEAGGSSPLGTVGYTVAAFELAEQVRRGELPPPDEIIVPLGSGGTVAGLVLGLGMAGLRTRVVAVRVVDRLLCNHALTLLLMARTATLLRQLHQPLHPPAALAVEHRFAGRHYGDPTSQARQACQIAMELEGLDLETCYGGKAMAALLKRYGPRSSLLAGAHSAPATSGRNRLRRVLFWHTYAGHQASELIETTNLSPLPQLVTQWLSRPDA